MTPRYLSSVNEDRRVRGPPFNTLVFNLGIERFSFRELEFTTYSVRFFLTFFLKIELSGLVTIP